MLRLTNTVKWRILSMHRQGYSRGAIALETNLSTKSITKVIIEDRGTYEPVERETLPIPNSKYDYKFEERKSQGKSYIEYVKENNSRTSYRRQQTFKEQTGFSNSGESETFEG